MKISASDTYRLNLHLDYQR